MRVLSVVDREGGRCRKVKKPNFTVAAFPWRSRRASALICILLLTASSALFLGGCAPAQQKQDWGEILWPLPPEEPRIKFIDVLKDSTDVEPPSSFAEALLGEDTAYELVRPYGVAANRDGAVYVTNISVVYVFDKKNKKFRLIGDEPGVGKLSRPANIAVSKADGKVYVSDTGLKRVFAYDGATGKYVTAYGHAGEFENPIGVAFDDQRQRLYIVDSKKRNVRAYAPDGSLKLTLGEGGGDKDLFHTPTHIALDDAGNIYVTDTQGFAVSIFTPEGKKIRSFGRLGDSPGDFARPKGIALDSEGHVYIVDTAFQNIQVFDQEGRVLLFFGGSSVGFQPGRFVLAAGVAIDSDDRIYVTDQFTGTVQIFQYLGERWKKSQSQQAAPR